MSLLPREPDDHSISTAIIFGLSFAGVMVLVAFIISAIANAVLGR